MRKGYVKAIILLLLFIFSTGRAESQLDDNVWPMLHRDMFHTGSSPFGGPAVDKMIIRKIVDVQAGNASPIIGSDGTVYIGSQDGCVYAVDPAEHESICLFEAESPVEATPIIASDGSLYFAALSGSVYGLKPDGTQKWAPLLLGDTIKATPALGQNGVLYVAVEDNGGVLFAIDTETGSVLWEFALGDIGYLTPAIDQFGNIYAGTMQGSLFSISVTGTLRWRHDAGESIVASPVISPDGTVYIATASALHAFDGFDGALRWTYEPEAMVEGEPIPGTLASSPVLGPDGRIFFAGVEGDIHCIIEKDGSVTQQWSQTLDYPLLFGVKINALIFAAPLLDRNGVLYVRARQYTLEGDEQVVLYTLDVSSGEILGSFNEFEALDAAQASSQDTLLALGADATLYLVMSNGMLYVLGAEIDAYEVSGSIAQVENGVVVTLRGTLEQTVEAGSEGKFVFPRVLPGEYLVYPFKDGCQFDPPSMLVRVNRSDQSDIVFSGTVVGPEIIAAKAVPGRIPNDGSKEVLITVEMNPDSYSQLTVQVDLSSLGGSEQQALYDDGSRGDLDAGDGIFSCRTAIGSDIALGQQGLEVVASDPQGKSAHDFIVIEVVSEISGSISASYEVEIDRAGQRLSIEYSLSSIVSLAPATRDMVLGQCEGGARTDNGSQVDEAEFYLEVFPPGTDTPIFETGISAELTQFEVEDAPAGTWVYKITKKGGVVRMAGRQTAASFQYSVATATAGSGMVFGMVIDADSGARLDGVALSTSIGGTALTVDGYYLLLSPAGMLSLSVAGSQHLPVVKSINLVSGDSVEANIFLTVQETSGGGGDEPGGSDCPLDALSGVNNRQFNLLRTFRDETLAKSLYGRMLIKQYYQFAPILKDVLLREPALREGFEHVLQGLMAGLEVVAKRGPER